MVSIGQCGTICDCAESQTPPAVKSLGIVSDCAPSVILASLKQGFGNPLSSKQLSPMPMPAIC